MERIEWRREENVYKVIIVFSPADEMFKRHTIDELKTRRATLAR